MKKCQNTRKFRHELLIERIFGIYIRPKSTSKFLKLSFSVVTMVIRIVELPFSGEKMVFAEVKILTKFLKFSSIFPKYHIYFSNIIATRQKQHFLRMSKIAVSSQKRGIFLHFSSIFVDKKSPKNRPFFNIH